MRRLVVLVALVVFLPTFGVQAQSPQVSFSDDLSVGGTVTVGEGIVFPDGTVQTTAAGGTGDSSVTANDGLYSNRIIDFAPPLPYVEVCFKNGGFTFDIHTGNSESTAGGNCEPGDKGWLIERDERSSAYWEDARAECLMNDMRLPEPFEFLFSCRRAQSLALIGMTGNHEWSTNAASISTFTNGGTTSNWGYAAGLIGETGCADAKFDWLARRNSPASFSATFRCVR